MSINKKNLINFTKKYKVHLSVILAIFVILIAVLPPRIKKIIAGPLGEYETVQVKETDIVQLVSATGKVVSQEQVVLKFQTSGLLTWLGVKKGDRVEKWQPIASLDQRQLEMTLKKELNDYMNERWDFEQTREDYEITSDDLDKYTLTNEVRRILEKAQFDLNNTVIDVEIADLAKKLATLVSPISGIVTDIEPEVAGVNVSPTTAHFTIANPSMMKFVADIDEADIGKVALGQKALITLDAYYDEPFEGEVANIAFAAVTTSGGSTAFQVDIPLPENVGKNFRVGMNGDVEIKIAEKANTIGLPPEAIKTKNGFTYVQLIEGRSVKEVEVEIGLETDTEIEVISGLKEGQLVITGKKK